MKIATFLIALLISFPAVARDFVFQSIEGTPMRLSDINTGAVLVVNTASRCGFTRQYDGLQQLYDTYHDRGLTVLAIPSNDFRQELRTKEQVQDFCEVNFNLTLPMTDITKVKGKDAHPLYAWLAQNHGFSPRWNFNKVLLDKNGDFVQSYPSRTAPMSPKLIQDIELALGKLP